MDEVVTVTSLDRTFEVSNPARYPYGREEFAELDPVSREHWGRFGAGHTVVDVGAAFGSHTLPALAAGAYVIAVEPSRDGSRILRANVEANGWAPRFELHPMAVFDGGKYPPELARDVFEERYPTHSDLAYTTLDAIVAGRKVDAVKIDVEGGELGVVQGGRRTLERHRPLIIIEDHQVGGGNFHVSNIYPESIRSSETIQKTLLDWGYGSVARVAWRGHFYILGLA